jgi:hypothetical protein
MNTNEQQTGGAIVPAQQPQRAAVAIGQRGLTPGDLDGLWRVAQYVSRSGLAPKGVETPEAVFVAMEMGLELGLPIMASLQNIAVVNGRPTLWGDSQLAVVRATGELEEFVEWYEAKGQRLPRNPSEFSDDVTAVCRVKRRGLEAGETAFSVADAKRAGLWTKQGPWSQYPARMLRFRARSFALRDQFGDALRGLMSTEEAQDVVAVSPTAEPRTVKTPVFRSTPTAPVVVESASVEPTPEGSTQPAPAPTAPPVVEATLIPVATPHDTIAARLKAEGLDFDDLLTWARTQAFPWAETAASLDEVPAKDAGKLARGLNAIVAAIKGGVR